MRLRLSIIQKQVLGYSLNFEYSPTLEIVVSYLIPRVSRKVEGVRQTSGSLYSTPVLVFYSIQYT